jgi:hypothetical protein
MCPENPSRYAVSADIGPAEGKPARLQPHLTGASECTRTEAYVATLEVLGGARPIVAAAGSGSVRPVLRQRGIGSTGTRARAGAGSDAQQAEPAQARGAHSKAASAGAEAIDSGPAANLTGAASCACVRCAFASARAAAGCARASSAPSTAVSPHIAAAGSSDTTSSDAGSEGGDAQEAQGSHEDDTGEEGREDPRSEHRGCYRGGDVVIHGLDAPDRRARARHPRRRRYRPARGVGAVSALSLTR